MYIRICFNSLTRTVFRKEFLFPKNPSDHRILFYKRDRREYSFLSNFYESSFEIGGRMWPTVEHYYQYHKSYNESYRELIRKAQTPGVVKQLSDSRIGNKWQSKRSWFRENPQELRSDWEEVKDEIMEQALYAKFTQSRALFRRLIATAGCELIEDSSHDYYWGVGAEGSGTNVLGKLLMELRTSFEKQNSN